MEHSGFSHSKKVKCPFRDESEAVCDYAERQFQGHREKISRVGGGEGGRRQNRACAEPYGN